MQLLEISSYWLNQFYIYFHPLVGWYVPLVASYRYSTMMWGCILMYVLQLYIYIICIRVYVVHIMNLKINIWTLIFLFKFEIIYINLKLDIWIWKNLFQLFKKLLEFQKKKLNMIYSKRLIWSKNWYLNSKLIFSNPKINMSIQKIINWL